MKQPFLILALALFGYCSYAQSYLPLTGGTLTGGLEFDASNGTYMRFNASGAPFGFMSNTFNAIGSGSKNDFLTWVYGSNPYTIWTNGQNRLTIGGNGNVGIGTTAPAYKLDVDGQVQFKQNLSLKSNGVNSSEVLLYKPNGTYYDLVSNNAGFQLYNGENSTYVLSADANNNVGIGTTEPAGYKLAVNGNIRAKEVKVETGWSDYVFYPTYKLRPLSEVASYIKTNQHLPDVPSAAEVEKNGINVGETNALLLKKIEELTLYLIEKDKEDEEKNKRLQHQQAEINNLKKQITNQNQQQIQINELSKQIEQLSKLIKSH